MSPSFFAFFSFIAALLCLTQTVSIPTRRAETDFATREVDNSKFTWFDVGLGACGQTNIATDFVVALSIYDFGDGYPGPHCFSNIWIAYNGLNTTAQVVDKCPGCPQGGLDLSNGLFSYFADPSIGVIYGSWDFFTA